MIEQKVRRSDIDFNTFLRCELLENMKASNVIVVVSRWFGGQLLGPARFKHIANTARQLLDECGLAERERGKQAKGGGKSGGGGRTK